MLKKLHRRLTFLFTVVTTAILSLLSIAFLLTTENNLYQNAFSDFQRNMNTLLANLEAQQTFSHMWLKKLENHSYRLYLEDNGTPYLFHQQHFSKEELMLIDQLLPYYQNTTVDQQASTYQPLHLEFGWSLETKAPADLQGSDYFAGCMTLLKNDVPFTAIAISSTAGLQQKLLKQRLLFLTADLIGALFFAVFSYYFTGRLLKPVKQAQERQIDFVAAASHELRTPLSVILAAASACQIAPPDKQPHFFASIQREGKRMQSLLSDLLFLANSQPAGTALSRSLTRVPADMELLLLELYEAFTPLIKEKGQTLSLDLPEKGLPQLCCDPEKITQLLSVLLTNAISYTPAAGHITLQAALKGKNLLISVKDTGCGIPDAEKKRVFERFYRAEAARSQKNHFGLGLSIAQDIASAHGGHIRITDNHPQGAIFTVTLPL